MAFSNAHNVSIRGSTLTNIEGDYNHTTAAPGERGISELFKASCPDAYHDSYARHPPPRCLESTRKVTLQEILNWLSIRDERILWLSGPAGSGKSAIAQTIAEACATNLMLGASFFFFAGSSGRNTLDRLVATIAYQLAIKVADKRVQLGKAVEDDLSILHKPLEPQFNTLIRSIFSDGTPTEHASTVPPQRLLIVIDGLDECKGDRSQREVVQQIGKIAADVRMPFRFLIVSRPEPQIQESFHGLLCKFHSISLADKHRNGEAYEDIYTFLRHSFDEIYQTRRLTTEAFWPGEEILKRLVRKSGGAFIYASTVVKYVEDEDYYPVKRLAEVLDTPVGITPFAELDNLYCNILSAHPDITKLLEVLTIVRLCNQELCSVHAIGLLLRAEEGEVKVLLRRVRSIVDVSPEGYLSFYHKSFVDFIHDKERAGKFFIEHSLRGLGYVLSKFI